MSRLVVQYPNLSEAQLAPFAAALKRAPDVRTSARASWRDARLDVDAMQSIARTVRVDAELVAERVRLEDFRLIAFDMDSTLITIECIDEVADFAGRKAEVSAITEATMRGEITRFDESLRRRVALLEGLPESVLQRVWDERVQLSPGAEELLAASRRAGLRTLVVSGGFTFFTDRLRSRLGLDFARSNSLEIVGGRLTGRVIGEIVDADVKQRTVENHCVVVGCTTAQSIVIGDGANDLKMMSVAGISVAYRAKPIVRSETTHAIEHCGLDSVLGWFADARP